MKSGWEYGELCRSQCRSILLLATWSVCLSTQIHITRPSSATPNSAPWRCGQHQLQWGASHVTSSPVSATRYPRPATRDPRPAIPNPTRLHCYKSLNSSVGRSSRQAHTCCELSLPCSNRDLSARFWRWSLRKDRHVCSRESISCRRPLGLVSMVAGVGIHLCLLVAPTSCVMARRRVDWSCDEATCTA
jgi:hypothetical protein